MRIVLAKNALSGPLSELAKVINNKSIYPILENFLFQVRGGKVWVTTSDNETYMTTELQVAELEGEGDICIPAKNFLEGIRNIAEQPITIQTNELEIVVSYTNGEFKMVGQYAQEFPIPAPLEGNEMSISGKDLTSGINAVLYASANDELRPIMNGVYFDMRGEELIFVTSDGTRLVACKRKVNTEGMNSFVLPKKPASLIKAFAENETDIRIKSDGRNARFTGAGYSLRCRLTEGRFPAWENVIPKDNPYSVEVDRLALISAIKRVSVFSAISGLVKLDIDGSMMKVQGENPDFSVSAKEDIPCKFNNTMAIGFKASHLIEMLSNISGESISLKLSEPSKAGLIENEDMKMILMPMVLQ